ncbi:MAG: ABC transporter ATP-binding protein [Chloroflexi bacterium]|nr:ABC transporter ATP-binding protein [Chloroflexota bacterium]
MAHALECDNLSKAFLDVAIVRGVSFTAQAGDILALLGPSGCGKTTTLRLIAGFEWPDEGTITINGRVVAGDGARVPPEQRRVGMVFQEYALFPHLNVADNVGFGLNLSGREKAARVADMLALTGLDGLDRRMPYELSGGQQQRVALARALAPQPDVLLLDEPFSNLDAALRMQVRGEVRAILKQAGMTCVFVTHDQEEALSLADQVAVMFDGHIAQIAPPETLYHHPASREVAAFVGEANFLPGDAQGDIAASPVGTLLLARPAYGQVDILIRPEDVTVTANGGEANATVLWREFYGHDQRLGLRLDDGAAIVARLDTRQFFVIGQRVTVATAVSAQAFPHLS